MLDVSFISQVSKVYKTIVILVDNQLNLCLNHVKIDKQNRDFITTILYNKPDFKGELFETLNVNGLCIDSKLHDVILIGIGDQYKLKEYDIEAIGGVIYSSLKKIKAQSVLIYSHYLASFEKTEIASNIGSGLILKSYKFDKYLTNQKKEDIYDLQQIDIEVESEKDAKIRLQNKIALANGVYCARDLINEPPNVLYPESYAHKIQEELKDLNINIDVLGEEEMHKLGMGAILGVGQGSKRESKMVIMNYQGGNKDSQPVCFVGKGVTFDTGGISLKPSRGMEDMKHDMAGSASVVGLMKALSMRKAKVNVVGIVGLVENMPGSNAQRPSDVVTTMSGKTVEVLNTDAEGRLVLCDCITYLQKNFKPACIVDLATLTGAIIVALGNTYGGCFSNNDDLAKQLIKSSNKVNEKLWRMPLHKDFDQMLNSPIADIANIGGKRGEAGSSTAAHFIQRFIDEEVQWAHLDIAGMSWQQSCKDPIVPKGATGFGVRLIHQFVKDYYESY